MIKSVGGLRLSGGWPLLPALVGLGLGAPLFFLSSLQLTVPPTSSSLCPGPAKERPQGRSVGLGAQDLGSNEVCDIWEQ